MITHDLRIIADAILDKKGQNVVSYDLRKVGTAISDYFIVCSATSTTAVRAISDNIIEKTEEAGLQLLRSQGEENCFWIIQDYGNIVIHIFLEEYREFYRLDDLWADTPNKVYKERRKVNAKVNADSK
ncbi:MAG: ribosome silencing factor [Bacteroidales bacterium]